MKRAIALSIVDQAVLSAQSLAISIVLISLSNAESVGRFALSLSVFFLLLSVQDALVGTPLNTRVFGRSRDEMAEVLRVVCTVAFLLMAAAAVATVALLFAFRFNAAQVGASVVLVVSGLMRELSRSVSIATGDMRRCVMVDAGAAVLSGLLLAALWPLVLPEVACLLAIGIGNLIAVGLFAPRLHVSVRNAAAAVQEYGRYLPLTRWSLLGAVSSEVQTRTFLFLVEFFRGLAATGTMHVGRLIVSPVMLVSMALGRIVLPRMAAHFRNNEAGKAYSIILNSAALLTFVAVAYGAALYLAWPHLAGYLAKSQYPELAQVVAAWSAYAIISSPGWCLNWLFRAMERLRELAIVSALNAAGVVLFMGCLAFPVPLYSVIVIMMFWELASLATLLWLLRERGRLRERTL